MKKFSKLISIFAALCMIATLFTGVTAFADGETVEETTPTALEYLWDADHDVVTVEFDEAITEESLAGIELYLNGAKVDATVALSRHASADDSHTNTHPNGTMTRYTYLVTPNNGEKIAFDTIYELKLTNVAGATSGNSVSDEVFFKVTKISDNMAIGTGHGDWKLGKTTGTANTYVNDDDGNIVAGHGSTGRLTLRNALGVSSQTDASLKDYTVKMTYRVSNPDNMQYELRLSALAGPHGYHTDNGAKYVCLNFSNALSTTTGANVESTKYVNIFEQYYGNIDDGQGTIRHAQFNDGSTMVASTGKLSFEYSTKWSDVKMAEDITLKLSTRDGFVRGYVNGMKFGDMELFTGAKAHTGGIFSETRITKTPSGTHSVIQKDFLVTKAEEVTVTTEAIEPLWDADSDFITLTFDKEMPLEALKGIITLKKNGIPVNATVALNRHADTDELSTWYTIASEYTYTIVPEDGMEIGAIYTLSAEGMISGDDPTHRYALDFTKSFKVLKLDEGMDYKYADEVGKWSYLNGNIYNIDGELSYDSETDKLSAPIIAYSGTPAGRYIRNYLTTSASQATTTKDYTVKMKFDHTGTPAKVHYRLYTHMVDHTANIMFLYAVDSDGKHDIRIYENESATLAGGTGMAASYFDEFAYGDEVELKLSLKDNLLTAYINNAKVYDAQVTNPHYGNPGFNVRGNSTDTGFDIVMSDYLMTKAVEVTDFEIGNISITGANGEAIESLSGNVNITIPVLNGSNADKDVYAVVAFYNGTKMTNCVASPVATRSIASGDFVTIPFANISPNGGDKLKVFVWDNTTSLTPYINNIEFPAAAIAQ